MNAALASETYEVLDALVLYLSELEDRSTDGLDLLGRVIAVRTALMEDLRMFEELPEQ